MDKKYLGKEANEVIAYVRSMAAKRMPHTRGGVYSLGTPELAIVEFDAPCSEAQVVDGVYAIGRNSDIELLEKILGFK